MLKHLNLFLLFLLSTVANSASAGTIVQSFYVQGVSSTLGNRYNQIHSLTPFDRSLGNLESVELQITGNIFAAADWDATNIIEGGGHGLDITVNFEGISGAWYADILDENGQTVDGGFLAAGISDTDVGLSENVTIEKNSVGSFFHDIDFTVGSIINDKQTLNIFSLAQSNFLVIDAGHRIFIECLADYCSEIKYNLESNISFQVSTIYNYQEMLAPVPEASTWAMWLLGFISTGLFIRNKKLVY